MRKLCWVIGLLVAAALSAKAQTTYSAVNGACTLGGQAVVTQGMASSGTQPLRGSANFPNTGVMASYPGCTVTVYISGSLVPAPIFGASAGGQLSNPFTANLTDGTFVFYAAQGCYDIMISSGATQASTMPNAKTFPGVCAGVGSSGGGGGGGSGTTVTINGTTPVPNALNFTNTLLPPANSTMVTWLLNGNTVSGYVPNSGGGGGGGSGSMTVNGATGGTDLNDRLPAQPPNGLNISWQAANGHISGALIGDGIATHCLLGTGVFAICPGGGSGGGGGSLPSTTDVLAGNGSGGALATGVSAAAGHILTQVIKVSGAVSPSPYTATPGTTLEYFPTGATFPPDSTNYGALNGFAAVFSHSITGGNGGIGLAGANGSGTAYQVYLDCEVAPTRSCDFKVPPTYQGTALGGGGGATVPSTPYVLAGNNAGGIVSSGVSAQSGFLEGNVLQAIGASGASPFTPPNASVEYFPTGGYGVGGPNGLAAYFSHSSSTAGASGNGGVAIGGGNATGANYQVYLDCEVAGCDFKVAPTYNGAPIGGGTSMTWPSGIGIANYAGSNTWGTSYSTTNPIPPGFNQTLSLASGSAATPAVGFATAPELGLYIAPFAYSGGALQGFTISTISRAANVVTATTTLTSTGLPVGATISVSGVADVSFNGVFKVVTASGGIITFNQTGPNGSSTGGLISPYMMKATGYALEFSHLQSDSNGAAVRGSIRLGSADPILYGCTGCSNSIVTGFGTTDQNLITPSSSTGPVKLGDYLGVSVPGPLTIGGSLTANMTGGPFCVHQTNGVLTSTGVDCNTAAVSLSTNGTASQVWGMSATAPYTQGWQTVTGGGGGGSGTVNTGAVNQIAYYAAAGTAVSGNTRFTDDGSMLTYSGANGGHFTGNLTVDGLLNVRGPWLINSVWPTTPGMGPSPANQSSMGINTDGNFYISVNASTPSIICTPQNLGCAAAGMVWPAGGTAGIPNYGGSNAWSTTPSVYNATNQIPGNFISAATLGTVPTATTAATATGLSLSTAPTNCTPSGFPTGITATGSANNCTSIGAGLAISGGTLTTLNQQPYEIAITVNSTFTASQVFLRKPTSLAYTIPAGCTNSQVTLGTATTAALTLTLAKNGTSFGTVTIAAGTTGGLGNTTFVCSAATSFAVGADVLTITAPATADTTAANFGGSFYATR